MSTNYYCQLKGMEISDPNGPKLAIGYNEREIVDLINERYRYYETVVLRKLRENKLKENKTK